MGQGAGLRQAAIVESLGGVGGGQEVDAAQVGELVALHERGERGYAAHLEHSELAGGGGQPQDCAQGPGQARLERAAVLLVEVDGAAPEEQAV